MNIDSRRDEQRPSRGYFKNQATIGSPWIIQSRRKYRMQRKKVQSERKKKRWIGKKNNNLDPFVLFRYRLPMPSNTVLSEQPPAWAITRYVCQRLLLFPQKQENKKNTVVEKITNKLTKFPIEHKNTIVTPMTAQLPLRLCGRTNTHDSRFLWFSWWKF